MPLQKASISFVMKTEIRAVTKRRIGQQVFRDKLIAHWGSCCVVTGINNLALLRASHIKPWSACKTDLERLDEFNGLLLSANLDAAFDAGLISFDELGFILFSSILSEKDRDLLLIDSNCSIKLEKKTKHYMLFHRNNIFTE